MSEVVDDISSETPTNGSTGGSSRRLKNLVAAEKWKSPFRSLAGPKNLHKKFRDDNNVSKVLVPRKFSSHPTLAAEEKRKEKEDKKAATETPSLAASTKSLKDQPIDTPKEEVSDPEEVTEDAEDAVSERPLAEVENADADADTDDVVDVKQALSEKEPVSETLEPVLETDKAVYDTLEASSVKEAAPTSEKDIPEGFDDDNIVETIKNTPIEIVAQPETKYEPVALPNQETLDKLLDKPILLSHYQALNAAAIGSVSRTLDDPNKVIDLGSGLKLTQRQLLDIAAKRVAPVIANINEEVEKTRREDEIKRQQEISYKVSTHESKLTRDFDGHVQKIEKTKGRFNADIDGKLKDLERLIRNAELSASNFERETKAEIETANTEFADRETKAVDQHGSDKETLEKNHTELEATKKQEIEDSKASQEKHTVEIEELQEKKTNFDNLNSEFSTQIEELTAELEEHKAKLDALKTLHGEKETLIAQNLATKEDLNGQIVTSKEAVSKKQGEHDKLLAEVAVLAATLATYAAKLGTLQNEKGVRAERLEASKNTYSQWQQEKKDIAAQIARDHEKQRVEALEAAETQRVQLEIEQKRLKEEKARKEQEEAEEAERRAKKEAEEAELKAKKDAEEAELKAKKEAEEAELKAKKDAEEAELKAKQDAEEEERIKAAPEYQRQLRIQKREEEQRRLLDEKEENDRIYQERKLKEENQRLELEKEIELLREQRTQSAENARLEAEQVAQAKLDEIEKLKREHDARLELFRERVQFEELQKERLLEEVSNLRNIRELREEKVRLAAEVNKSSQVEDIQKLIEQRELEVARLTKQIEYDDHDFLRVSRQREEASKTAASAGASGASAGAAKSGSTRAEVVPVSRNVGTQNASPVTDLSEKENKSKSGPLAAVTAGLAGTGAAVGAGIAGTGAAVGSSLSGSGSGAGSSSKKAVETSTSSKKALEASKGTPDRRGSLTSRFKKIADKLKGDDDKPKEAVKTKEASKSTSAQPEFKTPSGAVKPVEPTKAAPSAPLGVLESGSDSSVYSVYEEVSDTEYNLHKGDPNYFEVSEEELAKHRKK